jgi:RimJ/RimL family protein N-acetyltransferase
MQVIKGNTMTLVYLRSLEVTDLDRTYKWHSNADLYKYLIGTFHFIGRETEEDWLRKKQIYSPNEVNLAICLREDDQHIGNLYLRNIDWVARHAELHIFIGESNKRSMGYGQDAVSLLVEYAFKELGLLRIHLLVLAENKRAIRVYEKCGFVIEGLLRKHVFKGGEFKDAIYMGLCSSDLEDIDS